MNNILFIEGGTYAAIKKALEDWIELYSENLQTGQVFEIYAKGSSKYIIRADEQLRNEQFNYLLNYLKYPIDIEYKITITGFTTITEPTVFPPGRTGQEIMIFIPETDKEFDCVYWVGNDDQAFKTDWGGDTLVVDIPVHYEKPLFDPAALPPPELVYSQQKAPGSSIYSDPEEKPDKIGKRFRIILIIIAVSLLLVLFFYRDPQAFLDINKIIGIGVLTWFISDYTMLQVNKYFNLCLLAAVGIFLYAYLVSQSSPFYKFIGNLDMWLGAPLLFLVIQKPVRLGFKSIMKREPVVEKPMPSVADFIYMMILIAAMVLLGLLFRRIPT